MQDRLEEVKAQVRDVDPAKLPGWSIGEDAQDRVVAQREAVDRQPGVEAAADLRSGPDELQTGGKGRHFSTPCKIRE